MEEYQKIEREKAASVIHLPVRVNALEIERTINAQLDGLIYEDNSMEDNDGDQLQMRIEKNGDIHIDLEGQEVQYRVPLRLWIRKGIGLGDVEATGAITMKFTTHFDIDAEWKVVSNTVIDSYQWVTAPRLKMGFLKLPVKSIASGLLDRSKKTIARKIDEQIASRFVLQQYVHAIWTELQKPLLISEEYNAWMKITPESMQMTPLRSDVNTVLSTISINGFSEVEIGEQPAFNADFNLPAFKLEEQQPDDNYQLNISTEVPFKEAEKIALDQLRQQRFQFGDREVQVKDLKLFGQNEKLIVEAEVTGSFEGQVFLEGVPFYSPEDNSIKVRDLEFEVKTKNLLHKTAAWLFRKNLTRLIHQQLEFPLKDNIEALMGMINERLTNYQLAEGIMLNGQLEVLNIEETFLTPKGFVVIVHSEGHLDLRIDGI
ncbi:MAG: DUF4403 family protein [Bacteroidota bacterium]